MIKYFCDICGKEIAKHNIVIVAFKDSDSPNRFIERYMDSCEKCYNEIRNKYENLGTENDYRRGLFR